MNQSVFHGMSRLPDLILAQFSIQPSANLRTRRVEAAECQPVAVCVDGFPGFRGGYNITYEHLFSVNAPRILTLIQKNEGLENEFPFKYEESWVSICNFRGLFL